MSVRRLVGLVGVVMGCLLASELARADLPTGRPLRPVPGLPGDGPPLAMVIRGENTWLGDFDKDGNFLPDPRFKPNYAGVSGPLRFVWAFAGQSPVYEHRSGRLIKGTMVDQPRGVVVPEIGSTVLDIKDLDLKKPDRWVWNMPETTPAYVAERKRKYGDNPAPRAPDPPGAGTPPGYEYKLYRKLAPEKKSPVVARVIGEVLEFGRLSDEGEFIPDPELPVLPRVEITHTHPPLYVSDRWRFCYTLPMPQKREGQKADDPEEVYEYRSGRLIKGTLQSTGNFVPELGSKILDFKEYDPTRDRRRIYNLPGVLRRAE